MKMADGGYRPAYNVQMATAGSAMGGPRTVVGVRVTNVGSDMGSVTPMLEQIECRTGTLPKTLLADANHARHDCIRYCAERGVQALVPVPARSQQPGPNADVDPAVSAWRERPARRLAPGLNTSALAPRRPKFPGASASPGRRERHRYYLPEPAPMGGLDLVASLRATRSVAAPGFSPGCPGW